MQSLYTTNSKEETLVLGQVLADEFMPTTLVTLSGNLGAGKTTLTQGILKAFGAKPPYTSPTFVIMKEYPLIEVKNNIKRIYHVDAYRVEGQDLANIGFEEWCSDPNGLVLLEWPERIKELLPEKRIDISIKSQGEKTRKISISHEKNS